MTDDTPASAQPAEDNLLIELLGETGMTDLSLEALIDRINDRLAQ